MSPETALILEDLRRVEQARIDARRNTPHSRYAHVSQVEGDYLDHISRWGSAAYPVFKRGPKWWVDDLCSCGGCPSGFKTKREAVAFVETYHSLLLDKLAGRNQ